jgi:hypothetical protein
MKWLLKNYQILTTLVKDELLAAAMTAAQEKEVNEAIQILKAIRPQLDARLLLN